jgi:uncharacterized glyoxalase superfamily protein PhnB
MKTIEINGVEVNVIAEGIKKYGYDNLIEIDEYPHLTTYKKKGTFVSDETEDWVVIENDEMKLYMNNLDGYIVIIEFEKSHYEENRGMVTDKEGHIYYTYF